jgi:hypothetical protein
MNSMETVSLIKYNCNIVMEESEKEMKMWVHIFVEEINRVDKFFASKL